MPASKLRIGQLAEKMKISVETIRYYEQAGLMPPAERTSGGYRVYDAALLERLAFICNCRGLDMSLEEIRQLLKMRESPEQNCACVDDLLDAHLARVRMRIEELQQLQSQLQAMHELRCRERPMDQCDILVALAQLPLAPREARRG